MSPSASVNSTSRSPDLVSFKCCGLNPTISSVMDEVIALLTLSFEELRFGIDNFESTILAFKKLIVGEPIKPATKIF